MSLAGHVLRVVSCPWAFKLTGQHTGCKPHACGEQPQCCYIERTAQLQGGCIILRPECHPLSPLSSSPLQRKGARDLHHAMMLFMFRIWCPEKESNTFEAVCYTAAAIPKQPDSDQWLLPLLGCHNSCFGRSNPLQSSSYLCAQLLFSQNSIHATLSCCNTPACSRCTSLVIRTA